MRNDKQQFNEESANYCDRTDVAVILTPTCRTKLHKYKIFDNQTSTDAVNCTDFTNVK